MSGLIGALRPLVSRSPQLSRLYRLLRDEAAWRRKPGLTPLGFRFAGHPQMEAGRFEPIETEWVRRLLPSVKLVVNVGANTGYYCCVALQGGKKVVAFEPMPKNQRLLFRNILANGWEDRFECHPIAVSDTVGLTEIYGSGTGASLIEGWSGQTYSTVVPVSTLDTIMGHRLESEPCLMIVDVEGAELQVLNGATGILAGAPRPIWLVENEMTAHQPAGSARNPDFLAIFELFDGLGYAALAAAEVPGLVTISAAREAARTGARPASSHSFLFVDRPRVEETIALLRPR